MRKRKKVRGILNNVDKANFSDEANEFAEKLAQIFIEQVEYEAENKRRKPNK